MYVLIPEKQNKTTTTTNMFKKTQELAIPRP